MYLTQSFRRRINLQTETENQATAEAHRAKLGYQLINHFNSEYANLYPYWKTEGARKLKAELESQLIEKEHNKQLAYELFFEEKKMIDELVNKIKLEDQQRREQERIRIQNHRTFIGNKQIENEQRKQEEQKRLDEEERRNKEFEKEIRERQENGFYRFRVEFLSFIEFLGV